MASKFNIDNPIWGLSIAGYGVIVEGIAAIRQRMDLAIRTTKGTDPLRPEFGSYVYKFVDVPVNISVPNIKKEIIEALQLWVPEIKVISIRHSFPTNDYSNPNFEVVYRLVDEDLIDKLLFDVKNGTTTVTDALNEIILQAFFPPNPNNYRYKLKLVVNGSEMFPKPNPSGFETIQQMFDWAKSNWAFVGRWYLLTDRIVCYMNSEGITSASLSISVVSITVFSTDFPVLLPGQVFKVNLIYNGSSALPACPEIFSAPGSVLAWVQSNWSNYAEWTIEFITGGGSVFSDEFSDEMEVAASGYRLIGASSTENLIAELTIISL